MNGNTLRWWSAAAASVLAVASAAASEPAVPGRPLMFELRDLGSLGGANVQVLATNDSGTMIVGWAEAPDTTRHAFLWTPAGGMIDLGNLGAPYAEARDVNDSGEVVGVAMTAAAQAHAFYCAAGQIHDLNDLVVERVPAAAAPWPPYGPAPGVGTPSEPTVLLTEAMAINNDGMIVGCGFVLATKELHGFALLPMGGAVPEYDCVDLGELPMAVGCVPHDVNDVGQVVGESGGHAFIWGGRQIEPLDDFVRTVLFESRANAVNDAGTAVGWFAELQPPRACAWAGGVRSDLAGAGPSAANGINDQELIVGWSDPLAIDASARVATLWDGAERIDLNDVTAIPLAELPGFPWSRLVEAVGIDQAGRIVGYGSSIDGRTRGFVLTPISMAE